MTHPLQFVPGGIPSYYSFCECGRNITHMKPSVLKEHLTSELHKRWMHWDEHVLETAKRKAVKRKAHRDAGLSKEYNATRLENDKINGFARQLEWQKEVVECECGCVVKKGKFIRPS